MTTLAADAGRTSEVGDIQEYPVIASDIIYHGAAVSLVKATGHARPLTFADGERFVGFAEKRVDNSAGAAAAKNVRCMQKGKIQLSVTGAVITDVGQPVYAQDDDSFSFVGTSGIFIGFLDRFVSAGVGIVKYDVQGFQDPYGGGRYLTKAANYTVVAGDTGTTIFVTADAVVITMPAIADGVDRVAVVNAGAYGAQLVEIAPQAADKIQMPGLTATDDKSVLNTKATAQRGDQVTLNLGDADGYFGTEVRGVFAMEA